MLSESKDSLMYTLFGDEKLPELGEPSETENRILSLLLIPFTGWVAAVIMANDILRLLGLTGKSILIPISFALVSIVTAWILRGNFYTYENETEETEEAS